MDEVYVRNVVAYVLVRYMFLGKLLSGIVFGGAQLEGRCASIMSHADPNSYSVYLLTLVITTLQSQTHPKSKKQTARRSQSLFGRLCARPPLRSYQEP